MAGHPMRGGMQVPEKSKRGIGGVFRELLKFSPRLKLPMAVALLLAAAGTVLTIIRTEPVKPDDGFDIGFPVWGN